MTMVMPVKDGAEDVPSNDEANLSQGALSLPDFSAIDDEDARKAIACKATCERVTSNMVHGGTN